MSNYPEKVFLNGEIVSHSDAKISVFDRGFIFGDGIYEVMVKINGSFFYREMHLHRLSDCLKKINIDFDVNVLSESIDRLLKASGLGTDDCMLYIQVTRGVAPRKHAFPKDIKPTVLMYAVPFALPRINEKHIMAILRPDVRWHRCDIKMTSLLGNIMANEDAVNQGAYESLLIRDGVITEASHCNVFFVKDSVVFTHPANELILDGITRQIVIQICKDLDIEIHEKAIKESDIFQMDEAFLTGTTTQVASIKQIDNHYFYQEDTALSPITQKIQTAFQELKANRHD